MTTKITVDNTMNCYQQMNYEMGYEHPTFLSLRPHGNRQLLFLSKGKREKDDSVIFKESWPLLVLSATAGYCKWRVVILTAEGKKVKGNITHSEFNQLLEEKPDD